MKKLFEIPIYAFNRNNILEKYRLYCKKIKRMYATSPSQTIENCIDIETYPHRSWEYNHIVGFIMIYYEHNDICFKVYLPFDLKKYHWRSFRKIYVSDIFANGVHFYVDNLTESKEIQFSKKNL